MHSLNLRCLDQAQAKASKAALHEAGVNALAAVTAAMEADKAPAMSVLWLWQADLLLMLGR